MVTKSGVPPTKELCFFDHKDIIQEEYFSKEGKKNTTKKHPPKIRVFILHRLKRRNELKMKIKTVMAKHNTQLHKQKKYNILKNKQ